NLDYLVLEGLAERTIALSQKQKQIDPSLGYNEYLDERIRVLLPLLLKNNVRLITNMGAANPNSAAQKIIEIAKEMGVACKVVAVTGDDVLDKLIGDFVVFECGKSLQAYTSFNPAHAYFGLPSLPSSLEPVANIIVPGR